MARPDIAFVHTSKAHVPTFEKLMKEVAPTLNVTHAVHEDLLADAQRLGTRDAALVGRIEEAMRRASEEGAPVVMCTCSTIGGVAEAMDTGGAFAASRIDRAMADAAVGRGKPVLVAVALESTLEPTLDLLRASADRLGNKPGIETLVVSGAWPHFLAGEMDRYVEAIVQGIEKANAAGKVVVLAQASMAPAGAALAKLGIEALSSPRLGVERAVALRAGRPKT